jgi:hypothetical protein
MDEFPEISEKEVVMVMRTDIQRDYLRSMMVKGRGMGMEMSFGRFLWIWS